MTIRIVYSPSDQQLRDSIKAAKPGEVVIVRDALRWHGEKERADVAEVHGDFPKIAAAYGISCIMDVPPTPQAQQPAFASAKTAKDTVAAIRSANTPIAQPAIAPTK